MDVVRWTPDDVARRDPTLIPDELDGVVAVVVEGFGATDDVALAWADRAPCPTIAVITDGDDGPRSVDVVTSAEGVDDLVAKAVAAPRAAHVLVDVLRTIGPLAVRPALVVESLAYSTLLASAAFRRWLATSDRPAPKQFETPPVRTERDGDHLRITLARTGNRNAFSAAMRDALVDALRPAALDTTIRSVTIDADGPVFSSGGDLAEFGTADDVSRAHEIRTLRSVGAVIAGLAAPVTVRVHGPCVGAGVELPAFAGRVVARPDATFRLPEIAMGLIPGAGGTVSISSRIGRQRTAELALAGREMGVDEALAVGLVDDVE